MINNLVGELESHKTSRKKRAIILLVQSFCNKENTELFVESLKKKISTEENKYYKGFYYYLLSCVPGEFFGGDDNFLKDSFVDLYQNELDIFLISYMTKFLNNQLYYPCFYEIFVKHYLPVVFEKVKSSKIHESAKYFFLSLLFTFVSQHSDRRHNDVNELLVGVLPNLYQERNVWLVFRILDRLCLKEGKTIFLHETRFPILLEEEVLSYLVSYAQIYEVLLSKLELLPEKKQMSGLRVLTFALLFTKNKLHGSRFVSNILVRSLEISLTDTVILECGFCLFILTYHSIAPVHFFQEILTKYLFVITSQHRFKELIVRDVCILMNLLWNKHSVCLGLFSQIRNMRQAASRIFVLVSIFRAIVQESVKTRLGQLENKEGFISKSDDLLRKEVFLQGVKSVRMKNEIIFCVLREFLVSCPLDLEEHEQEEQDVEVDEEEELETAKVKKAWFIVGLSLLKMGRECLFWRQIEYNSAISQYGQLMQTLLKNGDSFGDDNLVELLKEFVKDVLKELRDVENVYAKFVLLFVLSFNISYSFQTLSGEDSKEIIVNNIYSFIELLMRKRYYGIEKVLQVEVLCECLLNIAKGFPSKIPDVSDQILAFIEKATKMKFCEKREELRSIFQFCRRKLQFLFNCYNNSGRKLRVEGFVENSSCVFESSYYTPSDVEFLKKFVHTFYETHKLKYNLANFFGKNNLPENRLVKFVSGSNFEWKIISLPNDPFLIFAKASIRDGWVYVWIKIKNVSLIIFETLIVEVFCSLYSVKRSNRTIFKKFKKNEEECIVTRYSLEKFEEVGVNCVISVSKDREMKGRVRSKPYTIPLDQFLVKPNLSSFSFSDYLFMSQICKYKCVLNVMFRNKKEINDVIGDLSEKFHVFVEEEDCIIKRGMMKVCLLSQLFPSVFQISPYLLVSILIEKSYEAASTYHYIANFEFLSSEDTVINQILNSQWIVNLFTKYKLLSNDNVSDLQRNVFSNASSGEQLDLNEHYGIENKSVIDVFFRNRVKKIKENN